MSSMYGDWQAVPEHRASLRAGQTPLRSSRARHQRGPGRVSRVVAALGILLLAATLVAGCAAGGSPNQSGAVATVAVPPAAIDLQQTVENVIHAVQPTVVEVHSSGTQGQAIGSGEIIDASGHIVTNDHVVSGFQSYQVVLSNGQTIAATLVGEAPEDDLAVLKVNQTGLAAINFGDSNQVRVGQFVVALGTPLGLAQSATFGIVSAVDRTATEAPNGPAATLTGLIQTSAPINPGNSGGALVDLTGKLIGIPTLAAVDPNIGSPANGIGFAIPSNRVKFIADQLVKNGHVVSTGQGFLGVQGQTVTPDLAAAYNLPANHGFLVTGFVRAANGASPAQSAGLQVNDIIIAVNGTTVNADGDLSGMLLPLSPGTSVQVTVQRGNSQKTLTVKLGERPPNNG